MEQWITRRRMLAMLAAAPVMRGYAETGNALTGDERAHIDRLANEFLKANDVPGLSVAFAHQGSLAFAGGYGLADKQRKEQVTADSIFRVASVSKMFTSAAVYTLIEAGKVSLDDPVFGPRGVLARFTLPDEKQDWLLAIRVRHLLTHTAGGWPNKAGDPMFAFPQMSGDALIQKVLMSRPPENKPGDAYAYSNFGYYVLGRVIEAKSGVDYESYVRQHVLAPCGIEHMMIGGRASDPARHEVTYYGTPSPYNNDPHAKDSCGGWVASPTELLKFAVRMDGRPDPPDLLEPATEHLVFAGTSANRHYGSGWVTNDAGVHWHNGSLPGTSSIVVITPRGLSWAGIINFRSGKERLGGELDKLMWQMARSVKEWGFPQRPEAGAAEKVDRAVEE